MCRKRSGEEADGGGAEGRGRGEGEGENWREVCVWWGDCVRAWRWPCTCVAGVGGCMEMEVYMGSRGECCVLEG